MRYRTSLISIIALVLSASISYARSSHQTTQNHSVLFLPIVNTAPALYGTVTQYGQPAVGVRVSLYFCYPSRSTTVCFTFDKQATNERGEYRFTQAWSLAPYEYYFVAYESSRFGWQTPRITEYRAGSNVHAVDFDIGSVEPMMPSSGTALPQASTTTTVTLQFAWVARADQLQDHYTLELQTDYAPCCSSGVEYAVGHTGVFSHAYAYRPDCSKCNLPVFQPKNVYQWRIRIENASGLGYTTSYTFTLPLQ